MSDASEWSAPTIFVEVTRTVGDGCVTSRKVITLTEWASAADQGAVAAATINAGLAEINQVMLDSEPLQ